MFVTWTNKNFRGASTTASKVNVEDDINVVLHSSSELESMDNCNYNPYKVCRWTILTIQQPYNCGGIWIKKTIFSYFKIFFFVLEMLKLFLFLTWPQKNPRKLFFSTKLKEHKNQIISIKPWNRMTIIWFDQFKTFHKNLENFTEIIQYHLIFSRP